MNQTENEFLILGRDSELLNQYILQHKSKTFWFSTKEKVNDGCWLRW